MRKLLSSLLIIFVAWLALNLFIVPLIEPGMVFLPTKNIKEYPSSIGLEYDDIFLKTADGIKINAWYIDSESSDKVLFILHGNGGNLSDRLPLIKLMHALPADIFIIDYHGYGRSGGRPSEQNLYMDAKAAYDYLVIKKKYHPSQIVVMGSSLGGAVAVELAVQEEIGALILKRTFTSAQDMAVLMHPLFRRPIIWLRSDFNNFKKIGKIKTPLLIVHSIKDDKIPYQMSEALFEKAPEPKKLLLLEKGSHADLMTAPEYINSLRQIIEGVLPLRGEHL